MSKRKKKNAFTLISLLLALVVLIGFYFWYINKDNTTKKKDTENTSTSLSVGNINTKNLSSLYFKNKSTEMTLVSDGKEWRSKEDPKRPINQEYVKTMLSLIANVKATKELKGSGSNLSEYGLSEPSIKIEAKEKDGKTLLLNIGDQLSTGEGNYATVNGKDKVYLIDSSYNTGFNYSEIDITSVNAAPTIVANNIQHIIIDYAKGNDFELLLDRGNNLDYTNTGMFSWVIKKPYEEGYTADSTSITNFLSNYINFNYTSCVDYDSKDLSKYGLDKPIVSIYVGYIETHTKKLAKAEKDPITGKNVTEKTYTENKKFKVFIGNMDTQGNYYTRIDGSNSVYTMNSETVKTMVNVDVFSLVNKFVTLPNIETVNSINITIDGKPYTMEIKRDQTTDKDGKANATYYYNGKTVGEKNFKTVYQTIVSATYDSVINSKIKTDGVKPYMTITYNLMSGKSITASYLPYDNSFYSVKSNHHVRFFADKRKIDAIVKAVKEFKAVIN